MRKIKITGFLFADNRSVITNQKKHCVSLGNGLNVLFTNINDVYSMLAFTNRFLNRKLFDLNEIYIELTVNYMRQWFYFSQTYKSEEQKINHNLKMIEKCMDYAVQRSSIEGGNNYIFNWFKQALVCLSETAGILKQLQKKRWNYVESHYFESIENRIDLLQRQLNEFGFDTWEHTPVNEMGLKNWKAEK